MGTETCKFHSNILHFMCDLVDIDTADVGFLGVVTVTTLQGVGWEVAGCYGDRSWEV